MSCAEPPRRRWLQRCGVLPALDLWLGMLRIGLTRLLQVWTSFGLSGLVPVMPACTVPASATVPAAATMVSETSALGKAPIVPAAAHSTEALAEPTNTMSCAEPPRRRWLQRCGVLPALDLWLGMLRIGLTRLLQVRTTFGLSGLVPVMPACTVPASATVPAAATMVSETSALGKAPIASAAAHSTEALAEPTNTMSC